MTFDDNGLVNDTIEVYLNDGSELSASTVADVYNGKMLIGSVASQLLLCDIRCGI